MSVFAETQIVVQCDRCYDNFIESMRREAVIKLARKAGWKVGKNVLCPKCQGQLKDLKAEAKSKCRLRDATH